MASRRLPDLGGRGEGWFLLQLVLIVAIFASAGLGPAWGGWLRTAGAVAGVVLACCGGLLSFRGLADLRENLTPFPRPLEGGRLVESGAYGLVRHPIYGGLILGAFGWGLFTASPAGIVGAAVLGAFFNLKSRREEVWLAERYSGYEEYRTRTRRMLPWLY